MGKNLYLYDKRIKQIQIANTDDLVYIPEDDFNNVYLNHKEDIDKNYGTIIFKMIKLYMYHSTLIC